jgi:excisionase family DNA binding protein
VTSVRIDVHYHQIITNHINLMRGTVTRKQQNPQPPDSALLDRDGFIDSDELAEYLRVPLATLDQWASRGGGPAFHKVGKHRRYSPVDIRSWLASSRRDET